MFSPDGTLISASAAPHCGSSLRKASRKFEAERHEAAKERRRRQKEQAASLSHSARSWPVLGAVGCAHQESDTTATNKHARSDHQPSLNSSLRGNQPGMYVCMHACNHVCRPMYACLSYVCVYVCVHIHACMYA